MLANSLRSFNLALPSFSATKIVGFASKEPEALMITTKGFENRRLGRRATEIAELSDNLEDNDNDGVAKK